MIYVIITLAVIARFIPHMPNFAPITALAIFSGANLDWKKSVGITLAARFVSDIFLGFFSWPLMVAVYACHLAGVALGVWIKNSNGVIPSASEGSLKFGKLSDSSSTFAKASADKSAAFLGMADARWVKIIVSSLGTSILFFLVTNFAFFYSTYAHNLSGIILAYTNGLPFFRGTLLGDLSYTVSLFGSFEFVKFLAMRKFETKSLIPNP